MYYIIYVIALIYFSVGYHLTSDKYPLPTPDAIPAISRNTLSLFSQFLTQSNFLCYLRHTRNWWLLVDSLAIKSAVCSPPCLVRHPKTKLHKAQLSSEEGASTHTWYSWCTVVCLFQQQFCNSFCSYIYIYISVWHQPNTHADTLRCPYMCTWQYTHWPCDTQMKGKIDNVTVYRVCVYVSVGGFMERKKHKERH